ncbi:olfactory receptor 14C36-like [Perognathus longimembris pacificus]|uniref:olfactory receptor 14C36-like n=1 Tax=Perognathus longimembris pacificus TaxID=214514 RepID=UPI0020189B48|nr:olfactory receptor 14C36-like [Perognathus longimembris pacificus]
MFNISTVTEFLLEGFTEVWELRVLLSTLFLLMYIVTILGNLVIVTVTTIDRNLHTPMYFFLRNLSLVDMGYISVTIPNAYVNSLIDNKAISVAGCAMQIFLVIFCASVELFFLTIMAHDRSVAICQPLHYPILMNHQYCVQTTLASLLSGLIYAAVHTGSTFWLSFCQSNVIPQFFCDSPSLIRLSCSDIFSNILLVIFSTIGVGGGCFIFIVLSYIRIFSAVLKIRVKEERGKFFSTCVPHILVVSMFLGSGVTVYLRPSSNSRSIQNVILSILYTIVPPFLNPIIYSLRNKQIKEAVEKIILGILYYGKL